MSRWTLADPRPTPASGDKLADDGVGETDSTFGRGWRLHAEEGVQVSQRSEEVKGEGPDWGPVPGHQAEYLFHHLLMSSHDARAPSPSVKSSNHPLDGILSSSKVAIIFAMLRSPARGWVSRGRGPTSMADESRWPGRTMVGRVTPRGGER